MPPEGVPLVSHAEILSFREILLIVQAAVELGINKVRITGGEPLVRAGITDLIRMIASVQGIRDISMTTNGILLARYAEDLVHAGLHRINISLDTLKDDRFKQITRTGDLSDTLQGIEAARRAGLNPVKINMVPLRGINEDEVVDFARMTLESGWNVRFIELMPLNGDTGFIPSHILHQKITSLGELEPFRGIAGNGAARYFRLPGASGTIGFISTRSEPFCSECNRLRLSATGLLYPCLFSNNGFDIKTPIRNNADLEAVKRLITAATAAKPQNHCFISGNPEKIKMSKIGG